MKLFQWTLVLLLAAGCGDAGSTGPADTLARLLSDGAIRVGYANEEPFAFLDVGQNRLTGEAPEVARHVLHEMGIPRIEGVLTEFGALIPGLKAGRFDMIAAGMYITPARCREVAFSNPTYGVGEGFLVAGKNPLDLHSYRDVAEKGGTRLGVVAGTVELGYARDSGIPDERLLIFPDVPGALAGLQTRRIEAFAGTSLTLQTLLDKLEGNAVERAEPFSDPVIDGRQIRGYGAFAFRKDDPKLIHAFNAGLARFIGTPEHLRTVRPFGFTEKELPGGVTSDELCRDA